MVREGMAEMLSLNDDVEIVGQAGDGREAIELAKQTDPDVVVLDVEMPVIGGQAALKRLLDLPRPPRVVVVTVFADQRLVREMLALGASAYLSKNAPMQDLISTVRSVAHGQDDDSVILHVPRETLEGGGYGKVRTGSELSSREAEVLLLAARGLANREMARALHLSETTVKRHLSNVYEKMGVHSRGEATRKALSEGWISAWDVSRED
jgi:DNA-binding NarL/FixJ family response regulator